jgi:hypothetical protein
MVREGSFFALLTTLLYRRDAAQTGTGTSWFSRTVSGRWIEKRRSVCRGKTLKIGPSLHLAKFTTKINSFIVYCLQRLYWG